ncbi:MAG: ATP-binding cassette domain-containing protein [Bacteroidales bacterium]|nr:ATP-binding cassette domain-containing protein [Bacteroidales bacterium]
MSEEILSALMELFGLIAKQDDGVSEAENEYVRLFLKSQIAAELVDKHLSIFQEKAKQTVKTDKDGKVVVASNESVKILGLCRKLAKKLSEEQRVVVFVRLYEMLSVSKKYTEGRMEIINTITDPKVFNISKEEEELIGAFSINEDYLKMDFENILVVNDIENHGLSKAKHITDKVDGSLIIMNVPSANMFFVRYIGNSAVFIEKTRLASGRIYPLPNRSYVKLPSGTYIPRFLAEAKFKNEEISSQPLSFEVKNMGFRFKTGGIGLRNINIAEEQGHLIGIMGASGAGKTTLLNVLCGNEKPSEGEVLINGLNLHTQSDQLEGVIGLIPQDDLLIEELTVYQNLYYNAKLCFKNKSEAEIDAMVCKTLTDLGLYERRNLPVGTPLNKMISGGQRKRLNIALELIREPGVLFVDEPTSGLSSRDSENVMNLLRELSLKGKLIFVVIHQPSSDIYKMFDKMFILDTGGYPVYYGSPIESISYFKKQDEQKDAEHGECPTCGNLNPELVFDILEDNVKDEYGNYKNERRVKPDAWHEKFSQNITLPKVETVKTAPPRSLDIPSWFKQFWIYTTRDFWAKISNTQYTVLNILEAPVLGFVLAFLVRYIVDPDSDVYIFRENENIPIYVFMAIIVSIFFGLIVSAEEIFKDAKILKREQFLNLSRSAYLMSKILILMGLSAIQMLLFLVVGNAVIGLKGMNIEFFLMLFSVSVSSNILGLIISSTFNSIGTIYIMIPLIMIPQMVLGGAMFTFDKLNKIITSVDKVPLLAEVIPARYAYEGLIVHQYKHNLYQKNFFECEMGISKADFKTVYYLPELEKVLDLCKKKSDKYSLEDLKENESYIMDLALLRNELSKEMKRNPEIDFPYISRLVPDSFNVSTYNYAQEYLVQLKQTYEDLFAISNNQKENRISYIESDPKREAHFKALKDEYYNETLVDIVRKTFDKNKILRDGDKLIQIPDPIYQMPEPEGILSFRTHFLAPYKYFAGTFWDTIWFNIVAIWVITAFLYAVLYYDVTRRVADYFGSVAFKKQLDKIKSVVSKVVNSIKAVSSKIKLPKLPSIKKHKTE